MIRFILSKLPYWLLARVEFRLNRWLVLMDDLLDEYEKNELIASE